MCGGRCRSAASTCLPIICNMKPSTNLTEHKVSVHFLGADFFPCLLETEIIGSNPMLCRTQITLHVNWKRLHNHVIYAHFLVWTVVFANGSFNVHAIFNNRLRSFYLYQLLEGCKNVVCLIVYFLEFLQF